MSFLLRSGWLCIWGLVPLNYIEYGFGYIIIIPIYPIVYLLKGDNMGIWYLNLFRKFRPDLTGLNLALLYWPCKWQNRES